jgi:hypothetical protein
MPVIGKQPVRGPDGLSVLTTLVRLRLPANSYG